VLVNDTGKAVTDLPVTVKIMSGDTVLYAERITMSVDAFSADNKGLARETLSVTVPAFRDYCKNHTTLIVTASYELEGETVYSQRKWLVRGGDLTDDQPPVYDWLIQEEETEAESVTDGDGTSAPTEPADTAAESVTSVTEGTTTVSDKKGCRSTVSAAIPLAVAGCALCLSKNQKRRSRR
jgi:hypothetical protein